MGLMWGCQRPSLPSLPAPHFFTPEAIVDSLSRRAEAVTSLKALARVSVSLPEEKFTLTEAVVLRKPASLRLESIGPMGQAMGLVVSDGVKLEAFSPKEKRIYVGRATTANVSRFLPVAVNPEELVALLLGEPLLVARAGRRVDWLERGKHYIISVVLPDEGMAEKLWLDPSNYNLVKREVYRPDVGLILSVSMKDFLEIQGVPFPKTLEAHFPQQGVTVSVKYQELDLNAEVGSDSFSLPPGLDGDVVSLD